MMIKIKKLSALLLVLALMVGLSACAGNSAIIVPETKQEAVNQYNQMNAKLVAGENDAQYDMDFEIVMDMKAAGLNEKTTVSGNIKMKTENGKVSYLYEADLGDLGGVVKMWSDGKKAYLEMDGTQTEIEIGDIEEQIASAIDLPQFTASAVKSFESADLGDEVHVEMIIDGKTMTTFVKMALGAELGLDDSMEFSVSDVNISYVADKEANLKSMGMTLDFFMKMMGEEFAMSMDLSLTVNSIGSGVEIELPNMTV